VRREQARDRILRATVDTLAQQGYAGTTARAIALRGGFAPGVIYYHYTDLDDLFRQTMRFVSDGRMDRYREQVVGVTARSSCSNGCGCCTTRTSPRGTSRPCRS